MRSKLISAGAFVLGLAVAPFASAQEAPTQADVVAACVSRNCAVEIEAYVAAVRAAGGNVDAALISLVTAIQSVPGATPANVAAAARAAAVVATTDAARVGLTRVAAAADSDGGVIETAASRT